MTTRWRIAIATALMLACSWTLMNQAALKADGDRQFEVWAIDQSFSSSGTAGTVYIYTSEDIEDHGANAVPDVIDLNGDLKNACVNDAEAAPAAAPSRGHMALFNSDHRVLALAFVASGHVAFIDAETRTTFDCIRATLAPNNQRQAHAAFFAPDDSYVVVANQNGKLLERINTDADGDGIPLEGDADIVHEPATTLNLAAGTTSSGAPREAPGLRPNNQIICPIIDSSGTWVFATLGGGGMFIVDGTATPMTIVAEYDMNTVHPNGCGGIEKDGFMYITSGAGGANVSERDIYAFDLSAIPPTPGAVNSPAPEHVLSDRVPEGTDDVHGSTLVGHDGRYLWVGNRRNNTIEVVDTRTRQFIGDFTLVGRASADPAPDLIDTGGQYAFAALRGFCPTTANIPAVGNAVGSSPGVGIVKVLESGRSGRLVGVLPIVNPVEVDGSPGNGDCSFTAAVEPPGTITNWADPHGLRVRFLDNRDND